MSEGPEFSFRFAYSEDEYVAAHRTAAIHDTSLLVRVLVVLAAIGFAVYGFVDLGFVEGLFVPAAVVLGTYWEFDRTPRRRFRKQGGLRKEIQVVLSESGVKLISEYYRGEYAWRAHSRIYDTDRFIFLEYSKGRGFAIPRRAMTGEIQAHFWQLAELSIGPRSGTPPPASG